MLFEAFERVNMTSLDVMGLSYLTIGELICFLVCRIRPDLHFILASKYLTNSLREGKKGRDVGGGEESSCQMVYKNLELMHLPTMS